MKLVAIINKNFRIKPLFGLGVIVASMLVPLLAPATALAAVPKLPLVWSAADHNGAVSADGQIFLAQGYVCPGATAMFNADGTINPTGGGAATGSTVHVNAPVEGNAEKANGSDVPTCGGSPADYAWTSRTSSSLYELVVSTEGLPAHCKNIDTQLVPVNVSIGGCTIPALIGDIKNGTPGDYKNVGVMKVDTSKQAAVDKFKSSLTQTAAAPPSKPACEDTNGFGLSWIICPIFNGVAAFSDWVFQNLVQPFLKTTPISTSSSDSSFQVWSQFRVYGNILLVIGLLVLVFGQSIGGGLIDAYTVKKSMPRILVAAILINLSVYIVAGLVDITNIVGGSIGKIMTDPLSNAGAFQFTPSGIQSGAILGGLGGTTFAGIALFGAGTLVEGTIGSFILLFIIMPVALGLLAAFLTLVIRKAIILALVLVSPVAFALYCLPNTEKYFRKWWDFLVQTLLVYPIVVIIFAVADILSVTVYKASNPDPVARTTALIISFVLQFLPLLMIPYAFKLAGGAVGILHETMSNYHKRGQEAVKGNANDPLSLRNKVRRGAVETLGRRRASIIRTGSGDTRSGIRGGFRRARSRAAFYAPGGRNYAINESRRNKDAQEIAEMMSSTGDDTQRYQAVGFHYRAGQIAQTNLTGRDSMGNSIRIPRGTAVPTDSWFDGKGRYMTELQHSQAQATFGKGNAAAHQNLEYLLRKKQTDDDIGNFRHAFAMQAVQNNWTDGETKGAWAAATYAHKGALGSEWYSKPTVRADGTGVDWSDVSTSSSDYNSFIKDPHKNRPGFELSKIADADWRAMYKNQEDTQAIIADSTKGWASLTPEQQENFAMTAEVLENATHSQGVQFNPDGTEVTVGGVGAASAGVIEAIFKNRKYGITQTPQVGTDGNPTGQVSVNDRTIYHFEPVRAAEVAQAQGKLSARNVQQAVIQHSVGTAVVTGDAARSNVGNSHTNT